MMGVEQHEKPVVDERPAVVIGLGNGIARKTFIFTVISAVLFVGAVVIFILNSDVGR